MLRRSEYIQRIERLLRQFPVVCILGARQVGKTTLARQVAARAVGPTTHFDLENPDHVARLSEPMLELGPLRGLVILDEIQRRPELFPVLRILADQRPRPRRFLVLGSAAPHLLRQSSETLAGRIAYIELAPFSIGEVTEARWERLWVRGGFPASFLARSNAESVRWRREFRQTFVERDVPTLEVPHTPPPAALGRFWAMLAHVHAERLNWSELGRSMGVSDVSVRRYTDVLEGALMVRLLKPWHANISKRQVKSPKLYFRDSGMLHVQLGIDSASQLVIHPRVGASWEGFVIEQIRGLMALEPDECFYWATEQGAELDLLVMRGGRRWGFEIKRTTTPAITRSMHSALNDLELDRLWVVHAGDATFSLSREVTAIAWRDLHHRLSDSRPGGAKTRGQ